MNNSCSIEYGAMPERLYVLQAGKVTYKVRRDISPPSWSCDRASTTGSAGLKASSLSERRNSSPFWVVTDFLRWQTGSIEWTCFLFFFPPGGNGSVGLQPTGGAFTPGEDQVGHFQEFPVHLGPLVLNQQKLQHRIMSANKGREGGGRIEGQILNTSTP